MRKYQKVTFNAMSKYIRSLYLLGKINEWDVKGLNSYSLFQGVYKTLLDVEEQGSVCFVHLFLFILYHAAQLLAWNKNSVNSDGISCHEWMAMVSQLNQTASQMPSLMKNKTKVNCIFSSCISEGQRKWAWTQEYML